jgi:hypothetical protein
MEESKGCSTNQLQYGRRTIPQQQRRKLNIKWATRAEISPLSAQSQQKLETINPEMHRITLTIEPAQSEIEPTPNSTQTLIPRTQPKSNGTGQSTG